ncbi:hypothetical protein BGX26_000881 [Mortierella sp. AD094]|nr:hypothetical protein BGX26_000881 [Mortierella sp. AD094]
MSVTTLAIHRLAMPLLRYCPNLRELSLRAPEENSVQTSLLPLLDFPNLEKLKIYDDSAPSSANRTWTDFPQIIPELKKLRSLAIYVFSLDYIKFLCAPQDIESVTTTRT